MSICTESRECALNAGHTGMHATESAAQEMVACDTCEHRYRFYALNDGVCPRCIAEDHAGEPGVVL